ncbi:MAG: phosphoenolpyruvate-protein phosphotransferase PtsI [Spirochaetaceae bacterium]
MINSQVSGISASPGIVISKAFVYTHQELVISSVDISKEEINTEVESFITGRAKAESQLQAVYNKAVKNLGEEEAEIFEGHIEILMDEDLEEEILECIKLQQMAADRAANFVIEENAKEMEELDNSYMRERAADIRDIGKRLIYAIRNVELSSLDNFDQEVIVFAKDLTPSDTAQLDKSKVLGFVTETGGVTSHVAIMAKSMEIPAIVGTGNVLPNISDGDIIILDASKGCIIFEPSDEKLKEYIDKIEVQENNNNELAKLRDLPAITLDGHRVELCANIGSDKDVEPALKHGAEGVGLYRTEFLYMDRPKMPTEDEQFEAYKLVAESMGERSVIIRTMDIGGDKELDYFEFPKEDNPFLGWRAIRMCLDIPEFLTTQLRGILRASNFGKLRIMFPMIISVNEIKKLKIILESVKSELRSEGINFDEHIEVGIMIETPAAAIIANKLIKEVDFFSIGTNDLTQYTLAVDRGNEKIAHLYQPFHPAVLNLIKTVIDASHAHGKWTGMCGEFAGNEKAALLLLGMGLDEFSMSAISIGKVKNLIRKSNYSELKKLANEVLEKGEISDILNILDKLLLQFRT